MPKKCPRESSEKKINHYKRKLQKLEEEQRRKRRRIRIESSSDSDVPSPPVSPQAEESASLSLNSQPEEHNDTEIVTLSAVANHESAAEPSTNLEKDPELDPELLLALGEETGNISKFGEKIHHSLAQRWDPILKKGLTKEAKDKLYKEYLVPENCPLLQAPRLNSEVAAAVSEAARHRDKRKETEQQQLGIGISSINKALTLMLTSTSDNKLETIRILSDGCRMLTDLHHQQTQARINVINYSLARPFLSIVQESERDDTLYGNKLGEKIKASKAIEKQGLSIKKFTKNQKTNSSTDQVTSNSRPQYPGPSTTYQGNWSGPPRFQHHRGGQRGARRPSAPVNRRVPHLAPSAASSNRSRAPATRQ